MRLMIDVQADGLTADEAHDLRLTIRRRWADLVAALGVESIHYDTADADDTIWGDPIELEL